MGGLALRAVGHPELTSLAASVDGYRFARARHPILVIRVEAAAEAVDVFGTAPFDRETAGDERRIASLPEHASGATSRPREPARPCP